MAGSRARKKKPGRSSSKSRRRNHTLGLGASFAPLTLPDDTSGLTQQLMRLEPEQLPTMGLTELHLAMSPMRTANQCVLACWTLMTSLRFLGLDADTVAATVEVEGPDGRRHRYGNSEPAVVGSGVDGHFVLIADDRFIDPTAGQFRELADHIGVRPVCGRLHGKSALVLERGGRLPVLVMGADGPTSVTYTVYPVGSADRAMTDVLATTGARKELAALSNNLTLVFTKMLSEMPDKLAGLTAPRYATLVQAAVAMRDKRIEFDQNNVLHSYPGDS